MDGLTLREELALEMSRRVPARRRRPLPLPASSEVDLASLGGRT